VAVVGSEDVVVGAAVVSCSEEVVEGAASASEEVEGTKVVVWRVVLGSWVVVGTEDVVS
jgi:hypothetical protein